MAWPRGRALPEEMRSKIKQSNRAKVARDRELVAEALAARAAATRAAADAQVARAEREAAKAAKLAGGKSK